MAKKKKREKQKKPWQWGGWLKSADYSKSDLKNIEESIFFGVTYTGESRLITNLIKNAVAFFLSSKEWNEGKPLLSDTKEQLKELDESVSNLLDAFVLDEPAMDWLQLHSDELTKDPNYLGIVRKTLEKFVLITSSSAGSFNAHSNPDEEKKIFLEMLAEIWKSVHGGRPQHKQIRDGDEYEQPFYHFI